MSPSKIDDLKRDLNQLTASEGRNTPRRPTTAVGMPSTRDTYRAPGGSMCCGESGVKFLRRTSF
jgi:hypothetical protein